MNKPARHTIPKSKLRNQLDEAEAIKRTMTDLLRELEESAGEPKPKGSHPKPGAWRHLEHPRPT